MVFVEQTPNGELARRVRETLCRLEPTMGFRVKVAERAGQTIGSKLPLTSLWDGAKCGRKDCTTCEQKGGEQLPQCTRRSLVYENLCVKCNELGEPGEEEQIRTDILTIYVGETCRSIYERSRELWEGARKWNSNNHMVKHQELLHGGEPAPNFLMRIVSHHKSALSRQVAEAVRIRRRGGDGAVLNSRGEFNRSYIPRLRVVEEEETEENREARLRSRELKIRELIEQDTAWEKDKVVELGDGALRGPMTSPKKRSKEDQESYGAVEGAPNKRKRRKTLKHQLLEEGWGEQDLDQGATITPLEEHPVLPREQDLIQSSIRGFLVTAPLSQEQDHLLVTVGSPQVI